MATNNCFKDSLLPKKKKILSNEDFRCICKFIENFNGLAIDCQLQLLEKFVEIDADTLKSIRQTELNTRLRSTFHRYDKEIPKILKGFMEQSQFSYNPNILINFAKEKGLSPTTLCRFLLQYKYKSENKKRISQMLKYPNLIDDHKLSLNIMQCLIYDIQDGPLIDIRRRVLGEEYEAKLKLKAAENGMHYILENDMRQLGYDKTPDLRLIIPCAYKEHVIFWIESKAIFGDIKTHNFNLNQQLNSYCNRFGTGIVIYWFGFQEDILKTPFSESGVIVLDDFPSTDTLTILHDEMKKG